MQAFRFRYWLVAVGLLCTRPADASIPEFFHQLFVEFQEVYAQQHLEDYNAFCRSFDLDEASTRNRDAYLEITFIHDLLTGSGAADCMRGGILRIPYFWHWVEPNPRHSIVLLPDSVRLSELPPPEPYARYKTCADMDRVPVLYLSDLVSASPRYAHPDCGSFSTFGWCSEREMSYVALMHSLGYEAKIKQSGIHTWSVVRCTCQRSDGTDVTVVAHVDNTFDDSRWELVPSDISLPQWLTDVGNGSQVGWYNRIARSPAQATALRGKSISDEARERIRSLIRMTLPHEEQKEGSGP